MRVLCETVFGSAERQLEQRERERVRFGQVRAQERVNEQKQKVSEHLTSMP